MINSKVKLSYMDVHWPLPKSCIIFIQKKTKKSWPPSNSLVGKMILYENNAIFASGHLDFGALQQHLNLNKSIQFFAVSI
jgi:hypothetical protein